MYIEPKLALLIPRLLYEVWCLIIHSLNQNKLNVLDVSERKYDVAQIIDILRMVTHRYNLCLIVYEVSFQYN